MIKTDHALLLNRLAQMQRAPCYATAKEELALAEATILQLERRLNEARDACRLAINAFERNDAIDWDVVARNATPHVDNAGLAVVYGSADNWFFSEGVTREFGVNKVIKLLDGELIFSSVQPLKCEPLACGLRIVGTIQTEAEK